MHLEIRSFNDGHCFWMHNNILEFAPGVKYFKVKNQKGKVKKVSRVNVIAVYDVLCRYANNKSQTCYPSTQTIAQKLIVARSTVNLCLKVLEKYGWIKIKHRKAEDGKADTSNLYYLLESPVRQEDNPPDRQADTNNTNSSNKVITKSNKANVSSFGSLAKKQNFKEKTLPQYCLIFDRWNKLNNYPIEPTKRGYPPYHIQQTISSHHKRYGTDRIIWAMDSYEIAVKQGKEKKVQLLTFLKYYLEKYIPPEIKITEEDEKNINQFFAQLPKENSANWIYEQVKKYKVLQILEQFDKQNSSSPFEKWRNIEKMLRNSKGSNIKPDQLKDNPENRVGIPATIENTITDYGEQSRSDREEANIDNKCPNQVKDIIEKLKPHKNLNSHIASSKKLEDTELNQKKEKERRKVIEFDQTNKAKTQSVDSVENDKCQKSSQVQHDGKSLCGSVNE